MHLVDAPDTPRITAPENIAASPIRVYEYLASGITCVVSAVGEVANVIERGKTGFLAKPGDSRDSERWTRHVMNNKPDAPRVAAVAQRVVSERHRLESAIELIGEILEETRSVAQPIA